VAWNKRETIPNTIKNMGFPRKELRKEDQTLNQTQGKHHVEREGEDIDKQQDG
jgi:hypothetical protein